MFENDRYITKGVETTIPLYLQVIMWELVETLPGPKDYLQVFKLSDDCGRQKIVHLQEQPEYEKEHILIAVDGAVCDKVFVIDDETHTTMLLASEY